MDSLSSTFIAQKPRTWRRRRQSVSSPPPAPAALSLTAASFDLDAVAATLAFDRAIDIASMDVTAIQVGTIGTGRLYQGSGSPTLIDAMTVLVPMADSGPYDSSNEMLFATDASGIVAVDDGGMWAGTEGTGLPFP